MKVEQFTKSHPQDYSVDKGNPIYIPIFYDRGDILIYEIFTSSEANPAMALSLPLSLEIFSTIVLSEFFEISSAYSPLRASSRALLRLFISLLFVYQRTAHGRF